MFTGRVGGGFGGKQEMLAEDLVALAVLRIGRAGELGVHPRGGVHRRTQPAPVPGRRTVAAGADGMLTALPSTC